MKTKRLGIIVHGRSGHGFRSTGLLLTRLRDRARGQLIELIVFRFRFGDFTRGASPCLAAVHARLRVFSRIRIQPIAREKIVVGPGFNWLGNRHADRLVAGGAFDAFARQMVGPTELFSASRTHKRNGHDTPRVTTSVPRCPPCMPPGTHVQNRTERDRNPGDIRVSSRDRLVHMNNSQDEDK
jgi:hypothetical protein